MTETIKTAETPAAQGVERRDVFGKIGAGAMGAVALGAAIEAYHAGSIRTLLANIGAGVAANAISAVRAAAGGQRGGSHHPGPELRRGSTAAQPGPNQVMAELLIAARAEGANSRWPL